MTLQQSAAAEGSLYAVELVRPDPPHYKPARRTYEGHRDWECGISFYESREMMYQYHADLLKRLTGWDVVSQSAHSHSLSGRAGYEHREWVENPDWPENLELKPWLDTFVAPMVLLKILHLPDGRQLVLRPDDQQLESFSGPGTWGAWKLVEPGFTFTVWSTAMEKDLEVNIPTMEAALTLMAVIRLVRRRAIVPVKEEAEGGFAERGRPTLADRAENAAKGLAMYAATLDHLMDYDGVDPIMLEAVMREVEPLSIAVP